MEVNSIAFEELLKIVCSVQIILGGIFLLISRLIKGDIMIKVKEEIKCSFEDHDKKIDEYTHKIDSIIGIMVKDKQEIKDTLEAYSKEIFKQIAEGDKKSLKYCLEASALELNNYENTQSRFREERSKRYGQNIDGTKELIKDMHNILERYDQKLDDIKNDINNTKIKLSTLEEKISNLSVRKV